MMNLLIFPVLLGSRGQLSNQYILAQSAAGLKEKISMHRHRGLQKLQAWPHVHSGRAERSNYKSNLELCGIFSCEKWHVTTGG